MKVLYQGKLTGINKLPAGEYSIKSSRFQHPTWPVVDRSKLEDRIHFLGYEHDKINVEGPFVCFHLVLGRNSGKAGDN